MLFLEQLVIDSVTGKIGNIKEFTFCGKFVKVKFAGEEEITLCRHRDLTPILNKIPTEN